MIKFSLHVVAVISGVDGDQYAVSCAEVEQKEKLGGSVLIGFRVVLYLN